MDAVARGPKPWAKVTIVADVMADIFHNGLQFYNFHY